MGTRAINPADMVLYSVIVDHGSFSAAASHLGITKQAVSERLAKLEGQLGLRLLERTTRRLRLTDAGAVYYERCAEIAAQIEEANSEARSRQREPVGRIRVSVPVVYGRRFLSAPIAAYLDRYPRVQLEIVLTDRAVDLIGESIGMAIRVGPLADSTYVARKIGAGRVCCVASPRFLERRGAPKPSELSRSRCIAIRPHETWVVGGEKIRIDPVLVVNDLELACAAARAGVGIARAPSFVCEDALERGELVSLFKREPLQVRPIYALLPSRRYVPLAIRRFLDVLEEFNPPALAL